MIIVPVPSSEKKIKDIEYITAANKKLFFFWKNSTYLRPSTIVVLLPSKLITAFVEQMVVNTVIPNSSVTPPEMVIVTYNINIASGLPGLHQLAHWETSHQRFPALLVVNPKF